MKRYYDEAAIDPAQVARRAERWENFKTGTIVALILGPIIIVPPALAIWLDNANWLMGWALIIFFLS